MPFSGEIRPAIKATGSTGPGSGCQSGTPSGSTSVTRPAAAQAAWAEWLTVAKRAALPRAAATTPGTSGGRWRV